MSFQQISNTRAIKSVP